MDALIASASLFSCQKQAATPAQAAPEALQTVIAASSVPDVVVSSFNSSFAGSTEVEWHKKGEHAFEVEFNQRMNATKRNSTITGTNHPTP